jgi:site-specific recombinase XerD
VKWKLIPQNPALSVDLPKQAKGEIQVLNPQQARDFLKEAAQDPYHVLFAVALTTSMRRANISCQVARRKFQQGYRQHCQNPQTYQGWLALCRYQTGA